MNTFLLKTTTRTRLSISRAQFSPLARRAPITASVETRIDAKRSAAKQPSHLFFSTAVAPETRAVPNFWSSGDLGRLQPEVTRYHY